MRILLLAIRKRDDVFGLFLYGELFKLLLIGKVLVGMRDSRGACLGWGIGGGSGGDGSGDDERSGYGSVDPLFLFQ